MYKSSDLLNWEFVGLVISVHTADMNGNQQLTNCQVQRPKLLYNKSTNKYVLWAHWERSTNFDASEVIVATANNVEGPYTLTAKGHHRPCKGDQQPSAMGERVGGVIRDHSSTAKNTSNTAFAYQPVSGSDYPPEVQQYKPIENSDSQGVNYLSQKYGYGKIELDTFTLFNFQFKAVSVQITEWDTSFYEEYSPDFNVDIARYIILYPTTER